MSPSCINYLHFFGFFLLGIVLPTSALNTDGVLLLSFKYSILRDPLSVLETWNYEDKTPCLWKGVTCTELGLPGTPDMLRVTSLVLPDSQLLGSIPPDVGYIEHLRHLDLSNNFLNGSLPNSFGNATELQVISLSNNEISGELPGSIGALKSLQLLNLSDNALAGKVPGYLTALQNLTVLSLRTNYFSGYVPSGFNSVEVLDLSSNLLNGSLPLNFGGDNLHYLNLSYNKLTGPISQTFAKRIPVKASIDLSFNNLSGAIPESLSLLSQKTDSFQRKFGSLWKTLVKSLLNTFDHLYSTKYFNNFTSYCSHTQTIGVKFPTTKLNRKQSKFHSKSSQKWAKTSHNCSHRSLRLSRYSHSCFGEETSGATTSDDDQGNEDTNNTDAGENNQEKDRKLVVVDGETELELETLLKASAYTLGTSGGSIVYKAVLGDGTAFAVRRIGESGVERLRDFENQPRIRWLQKTRFITRSSATGSPTGLSSETIAAKPAARAAISVARGSPPVHRTTLSNAGLFSPSTSSAAGSSPYQAPESLNNPKPNPKWDVYSFGVVLLELLTGRVFSDGDLSQWTAGSIMEDKNRVLRLADVAIQTDVEAREDAILACLKLGFSCASFVPQKRPSMKEALQILEKIPSVL
ncbi:hypothetical protein OIU85_001683 [Salix viminalis]|uniref:Leucine-rich repeat-containing N-terminal plant-type domain-containing protein n=1 Tax=Salix viminalis TaxID=40686 RepID=A0A9Q0VLU6_SALVM|nr:hypothetical protein OIU85_001683 [Salix viminalis]